MYFNYNCLYSFFFFFFFFFQEIMQQFLKEAQEVDLTSLSKNSKLNILMLMEDLKCAISGFEFERYIQIKLLLLHVLVLFCFYACVRNFDGS